MKIVKKKKKTLSPKFFKLCTQKSTQPLDTQILAEMETLIGFLGMVIINLLESGIEKE